MKLLINASNLRFGGGKTVGMNFIDYYLKNDKIESILLIAPVGCGYEMFNHQNEKMRIIYFPSFLNASIFKIVSNFLILPVIALFSKCDFVLSLGNVAFPTSKPQFLLIHQPYIAYPESEVWNRIKTDDKRFYFFVNNMVKFIKFNLKFANYVGVQTQTMKDRISSRCNIPFDHIIVAPNAVSFTSLEYNIAPVVKSESQNIKLLFLSKYYPHKNFEVLYEVGKRIKERQLPIQFIVTLDENENQGGKNFLDKIKQLDLDLVVVNIGNVTLDNIAYVYESHDGLFLPTLLESYSGTYLESMYFSKPIFTSRLDFALETCKDAAFYFDPLDPEEIIDVIIRAFENRNLIKDHINNGKKYISETKSWDDVGNIIDSQVLKI